MDDKIGPLLAVVDCRENDAGEGVALVALITGAAQPADAKGRGEAETPAEAWRVTGSVSSMAERLACGIPGAGPGE